MAECECLPRCPFFNDTMANKPATASGYKRIYCLGDNTDCARHLIFRTLGGTHVPADLFPNQAERAQKIVSVR